MAGLLKATIQRIQCAPQNARLHGLRSKPADAHVTIYVNGVHVNRRRSALQRYWRVMSGGLTRHAARALSIACGGLTQENRLRFIREVLIEAYDDRRGKTRTMMCACIVGAITTLSPVAARGPSNVSEPAGIDQPVVAGASLRVDDVQQSVMGLKASPIRLASLEESRANLMAAFAAFAGSAARTATAAPPKAAVTEVSVSGTPSAVRVEARQASIVEVLRALGTSFKLRYSATEAIDGAVSGTFYGPLPSVVGRILDLDGKNYFMQGPVDDLQVQILTTRVPVAQPNPRAAPARPGAAAAPPTGQDPLKECSYNGIPIEC